MKKEILIVSACFLKDGFKYDGTNNIRDEIKQLENKYELVLVCPEVFGGLSTPRLPSEQKGNQVFMNNGKDVTNEFNLGAKKCLDIALQNKVKKALLKAKSPSCGYKQIYDGTFTHTISEGNGVFAKLLIENNIEIYTEEDLTKLL